MLDRLRLVPEIGRGLLSLPDRVAHGLVIRDLGTWIRLEFLGVAVRSRIADALDEPRTIDEIAHETGITDLELLEAVLALGVSLREVRNRRGRYSARGRRLRAVVSGSPDLRGVVEALVVYDNPVYNALDAHLRGAPPQPYDADWGGVIAAASRLAEPILVPTLRTLARDVQPSRVLDIGCGTGIYLRHVLDNAPSATGFGIDLDTAAITDAEANLADLRQRGRCEVRHGDIEAVAAELGHFDLALLLNNIYYWAPQDRARILTTIGECLAPGGTIVVASATPDGQAYNRHLDIMLRVTASSSRLPTSVELETDLRRADFERVSITEPVPMSGFVVATGHRRT